MHDEAWRVSATKGRVIGRLKENLGALLEGYRCKENKTRRPQVRQWEPCQLGTDLVAVRKVIAIINV